MWDAKEDERNQQACVMTKVEGEEERAQREAERKEG